MEFAENYLREHLERIAFSNEDYQVKISKLKNIDGVCSLNLRKKKLSLIYNFNLNLNWIFEETVVEDVEDALGQVDEVVEPKEKKEEEVSVYSDSDSDIEDLKSNHVCLGSIIFDDWDNTEDINELEYEIESKEKDKDLRKKGIKAVEKHLLSSIREVFENLLVEVRKR
eukprot:TRINITY_DN1900_c0_g1_i1.p1 TRINITY_DN1900_c0_g1~~TRINITY_DN1900_c0_g1_i1.p1  ORF type:complete len:169 (+),score=62.43 TRINITY_DN1900_c0_g1_i1:194-700(+)